MENAVSWDVAQCEFIINRRFGGTCRLHLQVEEITRVRKSVRRLLTSQSLLVICIQNSNVIPYDLLAF
jgi:hypothetical protein